MVQLSNTVQLIGNLGDDVKMQSFDSGSVKASFSLAVNEYSKNAKGEKVQETQWHNIISWGSTAERMKDMLSKGSRVIVRGKLDTRAYKDKEGQQKYYTQIVVFDFATFDLKPAPF